MPLGASSLVDSLVTVIVGVAATAALGTLLAPVVKERIDRRSERLKSKVDLVDTPAIDLWTYWKLALRIAYYAERGDDEGYRDALKEWNGDKSWELGNRIQAQVSKARRLLSPSAYADLKTTQEQVVTYSDGRVSEILRSGAGSAWKTLKMELERDLRTRVDTGLSDVIRDVSRGAVRQFFRRHLCS